MFAVLSVSFPSTHFGQRAARAENRTVLHKPGEGRAQVVVAYDQVYVPEGHNAVSLDRADCHGRKITTSIRIDVQTPASVIVEAIAENLDASRAAGRGKTGRNPILPACIAWLVAAVGDHCGVGRALAVKEINCAAECAIGARATVDDEDAVAWGREVGEGSARSRRRSLPRRR